jgi:hypothetical protein
MVPFLAALAVGLTAVSIHQQQQAASAQRDAAKKQRTLAEIESSRQRTEAVRQARLQRARASNIAEQAGVGQSSGLAGGISSSLSNLGGALSYQNTQTAYGQAIGDDVNRASKLQGNAAIAGSLASLSGSMVDWRAVGAKLQRT